MSENISKNIYMINQKIQDFNKVLEEVNSFEKICNMIITNANKDIEEEKKYDFTLTSEENTKCYLQKKSVPVGWSNFVNNLLQTQIIDIKNIIHSFVLFIKKNENIYAITGGHGYNVIKQYIMPDFGITILEKTFDKSALVMKSMQDRALVGNLFDFRGKWTN